MKVQIADKIRISRQNCKMDALDDDEFDFDFVNNASKKVQSNWSKDFNREKSERSAKRDKATEKEGEVGCSEKTETPCQTSPVKRAGKENSLGKTDEAKAVESPVQITPPGSPTGGTPLGTRAVRGANRTNKTKKALAQLKKTTAVSSGRLAVRESARLEEDLLSSDEEKEEEGISKEDNIEVKVVWKGKVERVTVGWSERIGRVMDRVALMVGVASSSLLLYR